MKFEDVITVKIGRNLSRGNEKYDPTLVAYSYDDLIEDLDGSFLNSRKLKTLNNDSWTSYLSNYGEVVFSFVSSKASIVSERTQGKIINQNFAKLTFDSNRIDPRYLCYLLNESQSMKKQMSISMQGSTVPKLTPGILKELEIQLPHLEKQQLVGEAYFFLKKRQSLAQKELELEYRLYLEALNQLEQR